MSRVLLSLLSCLTLLTSVGLGHARGHMPVEQGYVICTGHVTEVIWVDAQGNETSGKILCPEAALGLLVQAGMEAPSSALLRLSSHDVHGPTWHAPQPKAKAAGAHARAPPFRV